MVQFCQVVTLIYWIKVLLRHPRPPNEANSLTHKVRKHKRHHSFVICSWTNHSLYIQLAVQCKCHLEACEWLEEWVKSLNQWFFLGRDGMESDRASTSTSLPDTHRARIKRWYVWYDLRFRFTSVLQLVPLGEEITSYLQANMDK